ncbi:hypothetical protein HDU67_002783 [Dinochytrium kinnereticum]|nr:hypothetical protein HDU67_002783 [Dinochytrium kinnereticum]
MTPLRKTLLLLLVATLLTSFLTSPASAAPLTLNKRGGGGSSGPPALPVSDLGVALRKGWGTERNKYPVVLVHGFAGFGRPLLNALNYWGGISGDTKAHLESLGYKVFVADLGPISSNWERACELFAQIKGTVVDYGVNRSTTYGFQRYGRNYTGKGFMPEWGTNPNAKINLITHSMGGPTASMMVSLLGEGFAAEVAATPSTSTVSELFQTNKNRKAGDYVNGVLTLAAPHKGTTLDDLIGGLELTRVLVGAVVGASNAVRGIYDVKLDHWGLKWVSETESFDNFFSRLLNSKWSRSLSTAFYDLSVQGTRSPLNSWVKTQPDVYYFSAQSRSTVPAPVTGFHLPLPTVFPIFQPFAVLMGSVIPPNVDAGVVDERWFGNDGVVNTFSMTGPFQAPVEVGWGDIRMDSDGSDGWWFWETKREVRVGRPRKGVWLVLGPVMEGFDHLDVTGTFAVTPGRAYVVAGNAAGVLSSTPL